MEALRKMHVHLKYIHDITYQIIVHSYISDRVEKEGAFSLFASCRRPWRRS